ncbi:MAG: menaquinone biosynthesis decarboxylase [Candidatus Nitrohelix vancouverensis]|uniref:Menaquinone biosynthesis decarboxylase n=1 Tax=Candidatus Nitrohelix vancouverensis TaxID=2705534 RepID=A0A7T0C2V9_9BACT|nr:MAG: menaquinone biosynthesis decarboxylase [Candidatus Nitrohelix vancouverensis]
MPYYSLREFITRLEQEGELIRIKETVSPILEISEITDRVSKLPGGGKALLFESVEGSEMPVLINAFGSQRRMNLALGVDDIEAVPREIEKYIKIAPPTTLLEKAKMIPMLLQASQFPPRTVRQAPCQEVVLKGDEVDLGKIPILQCWPDDAGRFITFPIVVNRSYDGAVRNVGLYRMQIYDKNTTAMHWHIHKDGAHFFHEFKKHGKIMETAVAIGADPTVCYAASAPLPYGIDEFLLSGFLRKSPTPLVKCKTVDLEVPATAEIVLEGYIDPRESRIEGPFGDHTGYYSHDGPYPVFHVTAITHRKNPIYLTTIVGKPPQEDLYLGRATERIFLPLMRTQLPEIVDMDMPAEGVFHNLVIISIDKRFPMQGRRLMNALWGMGQMSFVKIIFVVDETLDVHDYKAVAFALLNKLNLKRDLYFSEGILDVLNHASDQALYGSKLGIDLTTKTEDEPGYADPREATKANAEDFEAERVLKKFPQIRACQILQIDARLSVLFAATRKTAAHQSRELIEQFLNDASTEDVSILIVIEEHEDPSDLSTALWKTLNNIDPRRDIYQINGRLGIDASRKYEEEGYQQGWPEEIIMTDAIKQRVSERFQSLFS